MKALTITLSILLALALGGCIYEITQINALETQISNLQDIVNLAVLEIKVDNQTVNQTAGQQISVATFDAKYAGCVRMSGTSTTTNGYVVVNGAQYHFGTGNPPGKPLQIPLLPGEVSILFGNTNFINGATATLTVVYVY